MNWGRTVMAGVAGGVALWLADFALHAGVMGATYKKYTSLFIQEEGSPFSFLVVELAVALAAAILYAKTVGSWGGGVKGGMKFGLFLGLVLGFTHFINPLILVGFPYYLAWCWWGITLITAILLGGVIGAIYKA